MLLSRFLRVGSLALVVAFASVLSVPSAASAAPPDNGTGQVKQRHGHHHLTKKQKAKMRKWMKKHGRHHGGKGGKGGAGARGKNKGQGGGSGNGGASQS
jgi:hypothetical protein